MKRILWLMLLSVLFLFTSCLGTAFHTTFNNDGSGTLSMEVTVSQVFMQMGAGEDDPVDLPLSNADITEDMEGLPGITIIDQVEENTDEYTKFRTTVEFEDYSVLSASETMGDSNLVKEGGDWIYTMILSEGDDSGADAEDMDAETLAMMKPYFDGYEIRFSVTAPTKIKSYNMGELSADRMTVTYAIPTLEMNNMSGPEPLILKVVW
ncbi:MAG: hypothetical protein JEY99_01995 [Spirochaetales bacterium]|nr:hypothetical protein [Spirochaetales bacterium]